MIQSATQPPSRAERKEENHGPAQGAHSQARVRRIECECRSASATCRRKAAPAGLGRAEQSLPQRARLRRPRSPEPSSFPSCATRLQTIVTAALVCGSRSQQGAPLNDLWPHAVTARSQAVGSLRSRGARRRPLGAAHSHVQYYPQTHHQQPGVVARRSSGCVPLLPAGGYATWCDRHHKCRMLSISNCCKAIYKPRALKFLDSNNYELPCSPFVQIVLILDSCLRGRKMRSQKPIMNLRSGGDENFEQALGMHEPHTCR